MESLHGRLRDLTVERCKELEKCTDKCKDESDMPCINECGTLYKKNMYTVYNRTLDQWKSKIDG